MATVAVPCNPATLVMIFAKVFATYAEERLTRGKHAQSWEKTHLEKNLFTIWIASSSCVGYKIKDHQFSNPCTIYQTDNHAIHTMMIIVVIYMIIDQRDHHLCDQYDPTYHLNPNQADSHPKTSGKLCISSAAFESHIWVQCKIRFESHIYQIIRLESHKSYI